MSHAPPGTDASASDAERAPARSAQRALALCFFVSGATSLVLEVAWTKQLG